MRSSTSSKKGIKYFFSLDKYDKRKLEEDIIRRSSWKDYFLISNIFWAWGISVWLVVVPSVEFTIPTLILTEIILIMMLLLGNKKENIEEANV